jgi:hypothetical protein
MRVVQAFGQLTRPDWIAELAGREVDRYLKIMRAHVLPDFQLFAGSLKNPFSNRNDEAGIFSQWMKWLG